MNTIHGRAKFKNFRVLLGSVCGSTLVMVRIVEKLHPEKDAIMQRHKQAGNITNYDKVKVYFILTSFSATDVVTWKYHMDDYTKGRYGMILGRDILTELGLNLKLFENVIKFDDGRFKGFTTAMVDLSTYAFKILNTGEITPEEQFTNDYVEEAHESEHVLTSTKKLRVILDAKYEKADLHKVIETQY